jgi:nucleotide-binding universal stress UspA family protein
MLPPKLILSPIDFSDPSTEAVNVATDLAKLFGSELCLAHIVPAIPKLPPSVSMFKEGEYEEYLHREAVQHLERIAKQIGEKGVKSKTIVGTANDVGMELVRIAEQEKVDLVVIATHGMTGWRRLAFGSVTEKVVRTASCPVLVLRAEASSQAASL